MTRYDSILSPEISEREKAHEKFVREEAGECIVLLKNDGTLPLEHISHIALYGAGARDTIAGGTGSGDVNARKTVNVEQGLENAGYIITTKNWLDRQERKIDRAKKQFERYCREEAERTNNASFMIAFNDPFKEPPAEPITEQDVADSDSDTAIYVLHRVSGEGSDRFDIKGDYYLYDEEKESMEFLAEHYKNVVIVLNIGGIIDIKDICGNEKINAVVLMAQLGSAGGDALADVLSGKVNPSGKTTDTWAEDYMDYPSSPEFSHRGSVSDEYYKEGIYVGYRYFDTFGVRPRYPFGFGLSDIFYVCSTMRRKIKNKVQCKKYGKTISG